MITDKQFVATILDNAPALETRKDGYKQYRINFDFVSIYVVAKKKGEGWDILFMSTQV